MALIVVERLKCTELDSVFTYEVDVGLIPAREHIYFSVMKVYRNWASTQTFWLPDNRGNVKLE